MATPLAVAASLGFAIACSFHVSAQSGASDSNAVVAMHRFLAQPTTEHAYRAFRRLEAGASGQRGWLDAETDFTPAAGLQYHVTAEGGSGYIRSRVLRGLLDEERQLIARGGSDGVALSTANYSFAPEDIHEDGLARVALQPRRKERPLIIGRLLIRPENGELVRIEGRLAGNPSFWVKRVNIVRSYRRLNGVLVPVLLESTAQLRLLGQSTLRMTYRYSEIDNQVIAHDEPDKLGDARR